MFTVIQSCAETFSIIPLNVKVGFELYGGYTNARLLILDAILVFLQLWDFISIFIVIAKTNGENDKTVISLIYTMRNTENVFMHHK